MTRPSVWRPDRAAIGAVCLIAALAIPGAVAAQQSLDARTVADLLDVCAPQAPCKAIPSPP
jgi:hypothetical protein